MNVGSSPGGDPSPACDRVAAVELPYVPLSLSVVHKALPPDPPLRRRIDRKLATLERRLRTYAPDSLHVQLRLERHPRKGITTAGITLHMPRARIHAEESRVDAVGALDGAVRILLRELDARRSDLRRESVWKKSTRRRRLHDRAKGSDFVLAPISTA